VTTFVDTSALYALLDRDDQNHAAAPLHRAATSAYLAATRRGPSLVDRVSFELMRHRGIMVVYAFDRDFRAAGFSTVP